MTYPRNFETVLRGFLLILGGLFLLLYVLGLIKKIGTVLLIVISLLLIFKGFYLLGIYQRLTQLVKQRS